MSGEHSPAAATGELVTVGHSRWRPSVYTFGPVGRIVLTMLIVAPLVYAVVFDIFFLIAGCVALPVVVLALRDTWARVPVRERTADDLPPAPIETAPERPMLVERRGPTRW